MRIAIPGYVRMGRNVERLAVVRGHDVGMIFDRSKPITAEALKGVGAVIDFSHASAVGEVVGECCKAGVNLVTGTTGWDDGIEKAVSLCREAGIAMVHAANFSPGATILFALARQAGQLASAFGGFEAGIEERHHSKKKDAPSGTALRLAGEAHAGSGGKLVVPIAASRVGYEYGIVPGAAFLPAPKRRTYYYVPKKRKGPPTRQKGSRGAPGSPKGPTRRTFSGDSGGCHAVVADGLLLLHRGCSASRL